MKSKIKYTEEPMNYPAASSGVSKRKMFILCAASGGELNPQRSIKDFLPPPEQLVLKEENVKVTLALKKSSVEFFKKQAKKHRTSYQKMIRQVIDWYTSHYQKSA